MVKRGVIYDKKGLRFLIFNFKKMRENHVKKIVVCF